MYLQGIYAGVQTVYLKLGEIYFIGIFPDQPVAFRHKSRPAGNLRPDKREVGKHAPAPGLVLGELAVDKLYVLLQLLLPLLVHTYVLGMQRHDGQKRRHGKG